MQHVAQQITLATANLLAAIECASYGITHDEHEPDSLPFLLDRLAGNAYLLYCRAYDGGADQPLRWKIDLAAQHLERAAREARRGDAHAAQRHLAQAHVYLEGAQHIARDHMAA